VSPLAVEVSQLLDRLGIPHALIGAGALATIGASRATVDLDFLVVDGALLDQTFWSAQLPFGTSLRIRVGGPEAPLAGLIHISRTGDRPVDLVVGRDEWQRDILQRAPVLPFFGAHVPIALAADLVLLKLYAGGLQDAWDIQQLLASDPKLASAVTPQVEARIAALPSRCRGLWDDLRARRLPSRQV
jgi:hypothetical protein